MKNFLLIAVVLLCFTANSQTTLIPDANFEQALIDQGYDTGIPNGSVPTANISQVIDLDLNFYGISDLTGIQDFLSLQFLFCAVNQLTTLDLSQNTQLTDLFCDNNQLTSLNVSQNTQLITLICDINQLTNLDLSQNTNLGHLSCANNQLTSLDLTQNLDLIILECKTNQLTSLDISQNTLLNELRCSENQITSLDVSQITGLVVLDCSANQLTFLDVSQNIMLAGSFYIEEVWYTGLHSEGNNLSCIQVWDVDYANQHFVWTTETGVVFSLICDIPTDLITLIPDANFEQVLIDLAYDSEIDGGVLTANISGITMLDVSNANIADLTGIQDFSSLVTLDCSDNQMTSLDVSQNTFLEDLNCSVNQLTSLDVSQNTSLETLGCSGNQLTSLDVSLNISLEDLFCGSNQLTSLDVSQNTDLGYLNCSGNQLTSLDVSQNTALTYLACSNNQLTSLDVSQNTELDYLACSNNQLMSLDVSQNILLQEAYYAGGQWYTALHCEDNNLSCIQVWDVDYANENFVWTVDSGVVFSLDCSCADVNVNDTMVFYVCSPMFAESSPQTYYQNTDTLVTFDGCDSLVHHYFDFVYSSDTNLVVINDTVTYYDTSFVVVNDTITYVENITVTDTLVIQVVNSIDETDFQVIFYPNPATDILTIDIGEYYTVLSDYFIRITSYTGQVVFFTDVNAPSYSIPIAEYNPGIYLVQILDENMLSISANPIVFQ
jgi:Leucine-rich repeat (LRR) protein